MSGPGSPPTEPDRCDECGFEYALGLAPAAGRAIADGVADLVARLTAADDQAVRARAAADRWSPLEYACHLRDVLLVQRERVLAARRTERPSFDPMGRDERVDHDGYADQAVDDVTRQLADAARLFGNVLDRLSPNDWDRTVRYNYPSTAERPLTWVAVHTVHEVRHHALDVRHQLPG